MQPLLYLGFQGPIQNVGWLEMKVGPKEKREREREENDEWVIETEQ